jgi:hypothetical protein
VSSISGGTVWHWRAWRRKTDWQATSQAIAHYHQSEGPKGGELLLLGCSAGWMLPSSWLKRFSRLIAVDPDPLAAWLFRIRHQGLQGLEWKKLNALEDLDTLLKLHPNAAILFDNMLGQQALISVDEGRCSENELAALESMLSELQVRLRGRTWGSLHDRLSGPIIMAPDQYTKYITSPFVRRSDKHRSNNELMSDLAAIDGLKAQGEWLDHLTSGVFIDERARAYVLWPFARDYWHWLELAWIKPD